METEPIRWLAVNPSFTFLSLDLEREGSQAMRTWHSLWNELREVAWLTSVVGGLSVIGVALAVVLTIILAS